MVSQEEFLAMEEDAVNTANSIDLVACRKLGVTQNFLDEWSEGVRLVGAEDLAPFNYDDYPALKLNAEIAATELERLNASSA